MTESRPLVVVTTRLAPQVCGIGTYSWLLHQNSKSRYRDVEFCVVDGARESRDVLDFAKISEFGADPAKLSSVLNRAGAADVLLHYSGRAYHRYGLPRWLPPVLEEWRQRFPGGRLLIFVHEMPGHFSPYSRYFWIDKINGRIIARLTRLADLVLTNTQQHADQLMRLSNRQDVAVVPVASNIEPPVGFVRAPETGEFALIGLPFGRWQTLRCFRAELAGWQHSGRLKRLHLIGPNGDKFSARCRDILRSLRDYRAVIEHGMLPPEDVSALLLRAQFVLSNATDVTWSKSGVFMTYAAHGCNVIVQNKSGEEPLSLGIVPQEVGGISNVDLESLSIALRNWYVRNASWPSIATRISKLSEVAASDESLTILTPEAAGKGGVGDYTARLVEAVPGSTAIKIEVWPVDRARLARTRKLLVQYSAYGFDRHGYPRQLIRELLRWKRNVGGILVIMFHEIWTFWPRANKNAIIQFFHRRGIGELVRAADFVFTTTSHQAIYLRRFAPEKTIGVIPVGSNIPPIESSQLNRDSGSAIVFGLAGSRVRALREMRESLSALARASRIRHIVAIGEGDTSQAEEERELLSSIPLMDGFQQLGPQSESDVSRRLSCAAYGISERDEASVTKSGTFMAYAAHGLNVLNPFAQANAPEPLCYLISPQELLEGLSDDELKRRADALHAWQERVSSWESIASAFAEALQLDR